MNWQGILAKYVTGTCLNQGKKVSNWKPLKIGTGSSEVVGIPHVVIPKLLAIDVINTLFDIMHDKKPNSFTIELLN